MLWAHQLHERACEGLPWSILIRTHSNDTTPNRDVNVMCVSPTTRPVFTTTPHSRSNLISARKSQRIGTESRSNVITPPYPPFGFGGGKWKSGARGASASFRIRSNRAVQQNDIDPHGGSPYTAKTAHYKPVCIGERLIWILISPRPGTTPTLRDWLDEVGEFDLSPPTYIWHPIWDSEGWIWASSAIWNLRVQAQDPDPCGALTWLSRKR